MLLFMNNLYINVESDLPKSKYFLFLPAECDHSNSAIASEFLDLWY